MRNALSFIVLLTACVPIACGPAGPDDDGTCTTALSVCAHWGNPVDDPVDGGFLRARLRDTTDSVETPLGTDGCATMELPEGIYEWQVGNAAGECVSAYEDAAVDTCSIAVRDVDLTQWCMLGR